MAMNHKEVSQGISKPEVTAGTKPITEQDLRQQTIDLLPLLIEPTDDEKRELKEKYGLVFLPITSESYAQVVEKTPDHFWQGELDYANARPVLRDFIPPVAVEVGLREIDLALPNSFSKSRVVSLRMIEEYSQKLAIKFPNFRAIMLPATGYASADRAYCERNPGKVLFKNYFAWCLDNLSVVHAARAGRNAPTGRFDVIEWRATHGIPLIGAVPAVVKIGNR